MIRNVSCSALILRSRPSGEANREVWLLSAEEGIFRATVFGGPKSKLRSYAVPFHSGQAWIYRDPAKDYRKLSDFDVHFWRAGLRERYERVMAADAVAETVLASHGGGGNWAEALALAGEVLDALEAADEDTCARIAVWFLWRWAAFLGIRPELSRCASCGNPLAPGSHCWYSYREGGIVCADCFGADERGGLIPAGPGCRRWLTTVETLPPSQLGRYTMDKKSFHEAKLLTEAVLAEALGKRPSSWEW